MANGRIPTAATLGYGRAGVDVRSILDMSRLSMLAPPAILGGFPSTPSDTGGGV